MDGIQREDTHFCTSSFGFALGSKPCLFCLSLRRDPQLFHLLGLRRGCTLLSESSLDSSNSLFACLLSLCKCYVFTHFLSILALLLRFDLCNCGDSTRNRGGITVPG